MAPSPIETKFDNSKKRPRLPAVHPSTRARPPARPPTSAPAHQRAAPVRPRLPRAPAPAHSGALARNSIARYYSR